MTGKKKALIITLSSVGVIGIGIGTITIVSSIKSKNKYKVNETQWKEAYNKIFNVEGQRNFTCFNNASSDQPILHAKNNQEVYYPLNGASSYLLGFKYKKDGQVYYYHDGETQKQWKPSEKMFSETVFGLEHIVGVDNHYKDFSFKDDKYIGTYNNINIEIGFTSDKLYENIVFTTADGNANMLFNYGSADMDYFPPLPQ